MHPTCGFGRSFGTRDTRVRRTLATYLIRRPLYNYYCIETTSRTLKIVKVTSSILKFRAGESWVFEALSVADLPINNVQGERWVGVGTSWWRPKEGVPNASPSSKRRVSGVYHPGVIQISLINLGC